MRSLLFSLAALGALGACGQTTTPATETPAAENTAPAAPPAPAPATTAAEATAQDLCGASAFQSLIGKAASTIDQSTLPAGARIVTPTTMVTQDFVPTRLNITTDTSGNVASLSCY